MDILETIPKNGLKFDFRGSPIDPELRPLWRVSLIVLILKELCSGGKANAKKCRHCTHSLLLKRRGLIT